MYLYHYVPPNQIGNTLYPLNQLKQIYPNIYKEQSRKYDDIAEKDVEITGFGSWNDCINLMPVDPRLVKDLLQEYGHDTNWQWRFYKINPESLGSSKLVIMVMTENNGIFDRAFIPFSKDAFIKYCHIGEATRAIFQKAKDNDEQPNTFACVPHVLYKGVIRTDDLEVVTF